MENKTNLWIEESIVVPESVLLKRLPKDYGHVPGLDDSELLGDKELEQWVFKQEFEPILALPVEPRKNWIRPTVDEDGRLDWGAFGTVDFKRLYPFDKARYKADKLREELKNANIMFSIVNERVKTINKYVVLKYLIRGIIRLEQIVDCDMRALGKHRLRIKRLSNEIERLAKASRKKVVRMTEAMLGPCDW